MAYILANPDGTSNAKTGDKVVTGGGIYEKLASGASRLIEKLDTATGTTKNYAEVMAAYVRKIGGTNIGTTDPTKQPDIPIDATGNSSGIFTPGYDPTAYTNYGTTNTAGLSSIMGYVVLGLVGIALLDRFMNGGGRNGK